MSRTETEIEVDFDQLHSLIGMRVFLDGVKCTIIEVLDDAPALVLEACHRNTTIQPDQLGEAHRRVPRTTTIPVLNKNRSEFSSAFLDLDIIDPERS